MRQYGLYIFDLDGTLYRGSEPTPGAIETVAELRRTGALIRFLTNNSGSTRADLASKLARLGFEADLEEVYSSAMGAGKWCRENGIEKAFVVGEDGLRSTLHEYGVNSVAEDPQAVIAGICRQFDYQMLNRAMYFLRRGSKLDAAGCIVFGSTPRVRFVATNQNATYPLEGGRLKPGAGAIISAIETCSGVEPTVIGKPGPYMINWILEEAKMEPKDALIIGDREDTDIKAGRAAGCDTHLVLCGITHTAPPGQSASSDLRGLLRRI